MFRLETIYLKREIFVIIRFFPLLTVCDIFMFSRPMFLRMMSTYIPLLMCDVSLISLLPNVNVRFFSNYPQTILIITSYIFLYVFSLIPFWIKVIQQT